MEEKQRERSLERKTDKKMGKKEKRKGLFVKSNQMRRGNCIFRQMLL